MNLVFLLSLFTLPPHADTFFSPDTFEMRQIARLPFYSELRITCGDADNDGFQEFYAIRRETPHYAYILEFNPDMNYDTIPLSELNNPFFWFIGDLDRDGKTDLGLSKGRNDTFFIYESADSASLPLQCVWQAEIGDNALYAIVTDLDVDSALEFVLRNFRLPGSGLSWFENVGDDSYVFKGVLPNIPQIGIYGFGSTPDVDRDGLPEIFKVGARVVGIYEAVDNDSFVITAVCSLPPTGPLGGEAPVAGGPDIDGDGRNEAIVFAVDADNMGVLAIYESPENDSFEVVWFTYFPSSRFTTPTLAVGDVTGDGVPEIAVGDGAYVRLFCCTGNDQYEQFWQQYIGWPEVGLYDLNNDGKAEVICHDYTDDNHTTIYEYFPLGLAERQLAQLEQVSISPSVVARGKAVVINGMPEKARVRVLDVSGRVVAETERSWNTSAVSPGAYFIRITKGNQSITRKVLVVE